MGTATHESATPVRLLIIFGLGGHAHVFSLPCVVIVTIPLLHPALALFNMQLEEALMHELHLTDVTREPLSVVVRLQPVHAHLLGAAETHAARRAVQIAVAMDESHVTLQVAGLAELAATHEACVDRLRGEVGSGVARETHRLCEAPSTQVALERSLPRMLAAVLFQLAAGEEATVALRTLVLVLVDLRVLVEAAAVRKPFVALAARVHVLSGVNLEVLKHMVSPTEMSAAH